jgi:hypothetical protein
LPTLWAILWAIVKMGFAHEKSGALNSRFTLLFNGGRNRIRTCDFYRVNYEMFMFLISLSLQTRIVMGFLFFALVNAYLFLAFFGYTLWAILWAIYFTNY